MEDAVHHKVHIVDTSDLILSICYLNGNLGNVFSVVKLQPLLEFFNDDLV